MYSAFFARCTHKDCRRFSVVFDEQRELAARELNAQLPALPSKAGKKHVAQFVASRFQPLPKPQPLLPSDHTGGVKITAAASPGHPSFASTTGGGSAKSKSIVLGHADKRFILDDVESLPKQLKETPSFRCHLFALVCVEQQLNIFCRAVCSRLKGLVIECYKEPGGTRAVLLRSGHPELEVNAKDSIEAAKKIIAQLHGSIRPETARP